MIEVKLIEKSDEKNVNDKNDNKQDRNKVIDFCIRMYALSDLLIILVNSILGCQSIASNTALKSLSKVDFSQYNTFDYNFCNNTDNNFGCNNNSSKLFITDDIYGYDTITCGNVYINSVVFTCSYNEVYDYIQYMYIIISLLLIGSAYYSQQKYKVNDLR